MKRVAFILTLLFFILVTAAAAPADAGPTGGVPALKERDRHRPKYKEGELLIRFRMSASAKDVQAAHARVQAQVMKSYHIVANLQRIRLPQGTRLLQALRAYRRDKSVLYAEPNYRVHTSTAPNDPQYTNGTQWDLNNTGQNGGTPDADIDAPEAWNITTGDSNVVIGVIDTGVDYNHPDLAANMHALESNCSDGVDNDGNGHVDDCFGINAITGSSDPFDDFGHGTHVSGTIGAKGNNGVGVAGVNWNVGLVACKFLDDTGSGYTSDAITCLEYFKDLKDNHGLNLVATNNSWGGGGYSQALSDAIDAHRQSGILFMAAAGNGSADNDTGGFFPADYFLPNLISVAATDRNDNLAWFSNFGKYSVHLGAPGVDIMNTLPTAGPLSDPSGYGLLSGTSMATPHVAGVAALLKAQDPSRDWRAIKNLILAGGDAKASVANTITGKRLNAYGSLTCSNSSVKARLRPVESAPSVASGATVTLAVLNINCATPVGDVDVTINPGGNTVTLKDDGAYPDPAAGDGIYTGAFTAGSPGQYTVSIAGGETFTLTVLEPYFFQPVANAYRTIGDTNRLNFFDEEVAQITPSFPIPFGGGSFSSLWVCSDGTVSFDSSFCSYYNTSLPAAGPSTLVAPFWTDLETFSTGGDVYWEVQGSAPNRELVIEFRDVGLYLGCIGYSYYGCSLYGSQGSVRFQEVYFESKSDVLFNYADTTFGSDADFADHGSIATVGVQVAPDSANQFSFYTPSLDDNTALLWTTTGPDVKNPTPSLTSISPDSTTTLADFTLTVNGANYVDSSVVRWNGSDRPTTFVNSGQLTAQISAADVSAVWRSPATGVGTAQVNVFTFAGGQSGPATFTILGPLISSLSPASADAGGAAFTLTVNGSDFVNGAVVRWNGSDRATTFVSNGQLTASISAADIATPGTATVTVANPGGLVSNGASFTITAPPASVTVASPNGGESWTAGTTHSITWTYTGNPGTPLTVNLLKGGVQQYQIASAPLGSNGSGSYSWTIPANQASGSNYRIQLVAPAGAFIDASDADFQIIATSSTATPGSSANPSTYGQSVTFTTTVTASGGTPTGTVTFKDGANTLGTGTLNGGGQASFSTSSLAVGSHSVTAVYGGDASFNGSTSGALTQTVNKASTTASTPTSSLNPSTSGQSVTFTTTVTSAGGAPTGTVTFKDGVNSLGTGTLNGSGQASYSTSSLAAGSHSITAVYAGDASFSGSTSAALTQTVNPAPASVTVTSPNGGEIWTAGTTRSITWTYTGSPGNLKIELLKNGVLSSTISASAPVGSNGSGSFSWLIPSTTVMADTYRVRVTGLSNPNATDTSNANFRINRTGIAVKTPNGGDLWRPGTTQTIRWLWSGSIGSLVRIELYKSGVLNRTISSGAAIGTGGNGSFNWVIPSTQATGSDFKVKVTSTSSSIFTDQSDANFSLLASDFTLDAAPDPVNVNLGSTYTTTISATTVGGFSSAITLSCTNVSPAPASGSLACSNFSVNPFTPPATSDVTFSATSDLTPGSYTVTVSGTGGGITRIRNVTVNALDPVDWSYSYQGATPQSQTVNAGQGTSYNIDLTPNNGFSSSVSLTCAVTGAPAGVGCSITGSPVTPPGTITLNVTTTSGTVAAGTYSIVVTGTSGNKTRTTTASLTVRDFTLSVTPASQSVQPGATADYSVSISTSSGFPDSATLACSVLTSPTGGGCSFDVTPLAPGGSTTMHVSSAGATPPASYTVQVTATSGSTVHTQNVTFTVQSPNDFTITTSTPSLTVNHGSFTTATVTVTATGTFAESVTLSCTNLPANVSCFAPAAFVPSASGISKNIIVFASSTAVPGAYTFQIKGASATKNHSVSINLTVN